MRGLGRHPSDVCRAHSRARARKCNRLWANATVPRTWLECHGVGDIQNAGKAMKGALVTVSFRGDVALAGDLCRTVDALISDELEHVLIVPRRDRALFAHLESRRRRIVLQETLLPRGTVRLPLPQGIRLPFLKRRLRDFWLTPQGLIRGWQMQQIVKLSVDMATDREVIIFADSDIVLIRPLTLDQVARGASIKLYHRPGETKDSPTHRAWHRAATRLLGITESDYTGADYIGQLVVWRRSVLIRLHEHLERVHGRPWQQTLMGCTKLAEYVLYGIFAEHVLTDVMSGHFLDTNDLCHASWHYEVGNENDMDRFLREFRDDHLAVLIQSTTNFSLTERRRLIERMTSGLGRGTGYPS